MLDGMRLVRMACCADTVNAAAQAGQDPRRFPVVLRIMRDGVNRNNWDFRNMADYADSFRGMPILCAYVDGKIDPERSAHNGSDEGDFTGPDAERIVGVIEDGYDSVWLTDEAGERLWPGDIRENPQKYENAPTWVCARGHIYTRYAKPVVDALIKNGSMSVSGELDVLVQSEDEQTKTAVFYAWTGYGVTILGDNVRPAVPGANIKAARMHGRAACEASDQPRMHGRAVRAADDQPSFAGDAIPMLQAAYERVKAASLNTAKGKERKGGARHMKVNLQRIKHEWQPRFEKHDILGANESGSQLFLLDRETGAYYGYACDESESAYNERRLYPMSCAVAMTFNDGSDATVTLDEAYAPFAANMQALQAQLDAKDAAVTAAAERAAAVETKLAALESERNAERIAACKKAVAEADAGAGGLVDEAACAMLMRDIESGKYTLSADAMGKWNGADAAVAAYDALYGAASRKRDKAAAEGKMTVAAWQHALMSGGGGTENSMEKLEKDFLEGMVSNG